MLRSVKSNALLTGSAIYLGSNILNAIIPFALLPVLTRYLTPEAYGEVAIFQTLLGALTAFIGLSMHGAAGRKFYDSDLKEGDLAKFIGACLQILLITSFLSLITLHLLGRQFSVWFGLDEKWIMLAVITCSANVVAQLLLGQWQVLKKPVMYGAFQISSSLVNMGLSLAMVVVLLLGSNGRISAQVLTATIFAIVAFIFLKKSNLLRFMHWRPDYVREILKFGVPLIPHVGGVFLLASVDRFIINSELGLRETGIYMVAVQFGLVCSLVFDAINKAYAPWLFERLKQDQESEKCRIVRYTYAWYVLILCSSGLAFVVAPWIVIFVVGDQYTEAGNIVGWLVLGQVFGGMYLMVTNYIFFSKRTSLLSLVTISSGLLNVLLLFFLIGRFGLQGAAYAFCIAMATRFLLTWFVAQKSHPMPWFAFKTLFARNKA